MKETAADLAVALSLISVRGDAPIPQNLMALGEIGLTGEIMPVSRVTLRLKEALKMKFTHFILSERNKKKSWPIMKRIIWTRLGNIPSSSEI